MSGNKMMRSTLRKLTGTIGKALSGVCGRGAYRFAIRNWAGVDDINLLAEALRAETFRSYLKPQALSLDNFSSVLVLAPHQDDELIGAGGVLIACREQGKERAVTFVTNGRQRNIALNGKVLDTDQTVVVRQKEAEEVCTRLQ